MTTNLVTPAGRLHRLLSEIWRNPMNVSMTQAWSDVLGVALSERAELLRMYALVVALPDDIVIELGKLDRSTFDASLVMRWWEPVKRAFEVDFAGNVMLDNFKNKYGPDTLAHLEWCDDLLRRSLPGRSNLQQSDLDRIRSLVADLKRELEDEPDMDSELRAFLLHHANAMDQAVRDVPIRGTDGLDVAVTEALGDTYIRRPHLKERSPERVEKLLAIVQTVVLALQVTLTAVQIGQASEGQQPPQVTVQLPPGFNFAPPALPAAPYKLAQEAH